MKMPEVKHVSDELFGQLAAIWRKEFKINPVIQALRQALEIQSSFIPDQVVFFGRPNDDELNERLLGHLLAIAPGVVVLDPYLSDPCAGDYLHPLAGLLQRGPNEVSLFLLRPFSPAHLLASLDIWPSTFPKRKKGQQFKICSVYASIEIGRDGIKFGIDPGRWEVLKAWLDQWLPPVK